MLWHIQVIALVHDASVLSRKLKCLSQRAPKLLQSMCVQCNSGDHSSIRQENGPQGWPSYLSQHHECNEVKHTHTHKRTHAHWRWEPLQHSKWISFIYMHRAYTVEVLLTPTPTPTRSAAQSTFSLRSLSQVREALQSESDRWLWRDIALLSSHTLFKYTALI